MAIKITYFVHGTTEDNEKELSSGWNDAKLSVLGIQQSKELTAKTKLSEQEPWFPLSTWGCQKA